MPDLKKQDEDDAESTTSAGSKIPPKELDGFLFLPDGKVLVINNELYEEVLSKGIVIDLKSDQGDEPEESTTTVEEEFKENQPHTHQKSDSRSVSQSQRQKKSKQRRENSGSDESGGTIPDACPISSPSLGEDLIPALNQKTFSDITLLIDEKLIYAHKVVLASRSTFFEAMFSHEFKESEGEIKIEDVSYDLFMNLLEFMYSDAMKINLKTVFDVLSLAD